MALFRNQVPATRSQNPISMWQKELNNLFDRFGRDLESSSEMEMGGFSPKVEVREREKTYIVCAEVPGIKESDINVTLRDNNLLLEGERRPEATKEEKEGFYASEFNYGSFSRTIPLDEEVNPDSVKASYRNGILTVELEKVRTSSHKVKKIPIMKS